MCGLVNMGQSYNKRGFRPRFSAFFSELFCPAGAVRDALPPLLRDMQRAPACCLKKITLGVFQFALGVDLFAWDVDWES